jgi:site-specific DNA-methyltransferase (adenine-specific)
MPTSSTPIPDAARQAPFHEEDGITIYHGDCRDLLPIKATVTVVDPPYGTGYYLSDDDSFNPSVVASLAEAGPLAVFGWPEALSAVCLSLGKRADEWICWNPTNGRARGFNRHGLWRESEHIAIFGKGDWARLRQARVKTTTPIPDTGRRVKGATGDVRMGDVWTDPSPNLNPRQLHKRHHPNEKPVPVLERLILALTEPGDIVLDPCMGSGTTLIAARNLGRRAVGIEIEEKHCLTAVERLGRPTLEIEAAIREVGGCPDIWCQECRDHGVIYTAGPDGGPHPCRACAEQRLNEPDPFDEDEEQPEPSSSDQEGEAKRTARAKLRAALEEAENG